MNEPKWTKGPWQWEFIGTLGNEYLVDADGFLVNKPEDKVLQAAAPELYAELAEIVEFLDRASFRDKDDEIATGFIISACAILSRARGEA